MISIPALVEHPAGRFVAEAPRGRDAFTVAAMTAPGPVVRFQGPVEGVGVLGVEGVARRELGGIALFGLVGGVDFADDREQAGQR